MLLFAGSPLRDYISQHQQALHDEVYGTPDEHVLHADIVAWAVALGEAYAVHAPVLRPDEMCADPPESSVVIDEYGRQLTGTSVRVYVPFSGDATVFKLQASTHAWNLPSADIRPDALVFDLSWPQHEQFDLGTYMRQELQRIETALEWSRTDCASHNNGLDGYAKAQIENRARAIRDSRAVVEASGIPIRSSAGKRNIIESIVRRPGRRAVGPSDARPAVQLDPVLSDEACEHILAIIRNQGDAMQRSPGSYAGMLEQDLRQVLASGLNTHYVGRVAAEAFNGAGKTDLLVRDGDRAVFIAECKRWTGQKELCRALDQLLGYATWNDTKLALVVFVSRGNLAEVVARAKALSEHTAVSDLRTNEDATLRCRLVFGAEGERRADLAVLFIHLPEGSTSVSLT